ELNMYEYWSHAAQHFIQNGIDKKMHDKQQIKCFALHYIAFICLYCLENLAFFLYRDLGNFKVRVFFVWIYLTSKSTINVELITTLEHEIMCFALALGVNRNIASFDFGVIGSFFGFTKNELPNLMQFYDVSYMHFILVRYGLIMFFTACNGLMSLGHVGT
ncbi:hypothetical protein ACJX0J_026362, partial [Zea mays]